MQKLQGPSLRRDPEVIVGEGGLEPPRPEGHWHLKPARLPFRHSPASSVAVRLHKDSTRAAECVKSAAQFIFFWCSVTALLQSERVAGALRPLY